MGNTYIRRGMLCTCLALLLSGCATRPSVSHTQLSAHRAQLDPSGLVLESVDAVRASCAVPMGWEALPTRTTALYSHHQWRSVSHRTGVGVIYIRMPLPLSAKAVVWMANLEYAKKSNDGRVLRQWTDAMGREWFEAENNSYHARGFVITKGFEAWIGYTGYRRNEPMETADVELAGKSLDSMVPAFSGSEPRQPLAAASAE